MNILFTGDRGFLAGYTIEELLMHDHTIIGVDNYSKYGKIKKTYDNHKEYIHFEHDARDIDFLAGLIEKYQIRQVIAAAALIGGISYFHSIPYTLLKENEEITIAIFEAIFRSYIRVDKINMISSSMVFENTEVYPSKESHVETVRVPLSSYGFQKLATEYYCKSAYEEHGLPYTIIRPFNCVGIGESRALLEKSIPSGNINLALSHVVPDLCQKVLKGQDPVHILGMGDQMRCYTYGGDIARGIRLCVESDKSVNEDFNISNERQLTVYELLKLIWNRINPDKLLSVKHDEPFKHDVKFRLPDVSKAEHILKFKAETDIEDVIDDIIEWMRIEIANGNI
jgi:nucleoside-diphosphate-sugar epimerase